MDILFDPAEGEFSLVNGRAVALTGAEAKAQRIRNRLLTVRGAWFMDLNYGLDYRNIIWPKEVSFAIKAAHVKEVILQACVEPGATSTEDTITEFNMNFDGREREMSLAVTLQTAEGLLTVEV